MNNHSEPVLITGAGQRLGLYSEESGYSDRARRTGCLADITVRTPQSLFNRRGDSSARWTTSALSGYSLFRSIFVNGKCIVPVTVFVK